MKGEYLTHTAPEDSTGRRLVTDLIEFLIETNSKETLKAISCDGTAIERDLQQRLLPRLLTPEGSK